MSRKAPALPWSILTPIPFAVWEIDIMGPLPKAKGELQYVMVAIDYMTKWGEAKALKNITQEDAIRFVKDHITTIFETPMVLLSENGTQFMRSKFTKFLSEHEVKHKKASVYHPQSKGQVEVTNRIIVKGLEKPNTIIKEVGGIINPCTMVLPHHIKNKRWSIIVRVNIQAKALAPVEIGSPYFRMVNFNEETNAQGLATNIVR